MTDFNQITDRNVAIFEERTRALQNLISQADQRLHLMQRSRASEKHSEARYRELAQNEHQIRSNNARRHNQQRTQQARIRELARQGYSHSDISQRVGVSIAEIEALLAFPETEAEPHEDTDNTDN